jgi:hypothetical protein
MPKDARNAQAKACLSILSIKCLALHPWRSTPRLHVTHGRGKIDLHFDGGELRLGRNLLRLAGFKRAENYDYRDLVIEI